MFRHAGVPGPLDWKLFSVKGRVNTQRPGPGRGLYLERLDAKLHEDCNNRDRGPQEGSTQADLSVIIITSLE